MGRLPHSGMPGAPTGPALRSTNTVFSSTSAPDRESPIRAWHVGAPNTTARGHDALNFRSWPRV